MEKKGDIPEVSAEILSHPYVQHLHKVIEVLVKRVESLELELSDLKEEISDLKKVPKKPKINPSNLDEEKNKEKESKGSKRAGNEKRKKKKGLPIDEKRKVKAKGVPQGWILVGYKSYVVQDILIRRNNIKYEREVWQSKDGRQRMVADLPKSIAGRDFGEEIRRYVINLYNECHVTQPIIYAN